MTSRTTKAFLRNLPVEVKRNARDTYKTWIADPRHPSLHFKKVHPVQPIWSVRITQDFRAVAVWRDDTVIWFRIGRHEDYERLLQNL